MRGKCIGVLVASPFIAEGVKVLIRNISGAVISVGPWVDGNGEMPEVVVSDIFMRSQCPPGSKVIGVLVQVVPEDTMRLFDDTVTLYDDPSELCRKIKNLFAPDHLHDSRGNDLSPREKDVVLLVVKGLSNKEIASQMNVSVNTVMTHRRNIASKLKIHSPAALTIFALATGLVKMEEIRD